MKIFKTSIMSLFVGFLVFFDGLMAQSGGTLPNFSLGAGARALGLGGACVALPLDASTVYWNPAALDHLEQKSVTLFYTSLLESAQYNYFGYVHPTINFGTLGFGILRLGVGDDIDYRVDSPLSLGQFGHNEYEFLFSYGKYIRKANISIGGNLKVDHRSWPGIANNKYSDTSVGADIAIYFRPNLNGYLRGLSTGLMIQNIISPTLRENEAKDKFPINLKAGLAKSIELPQWGGSMLFLLDISKAELNPTKFHFGTEYVYNNMAMLRMGLNNGEMVFGAGVAYNIFQFDYSYGSSADAYFSASHRISLTINFGKTKTELIEIAERRRMEEIADEVRRQRQLEREQEIQERMTEGKRYFREGDFLNARIAFMAVLKRDEDHEEAKELLAKADQKNDEQEQKLWESRQEKLRLEQAQIEREKKIHLHWQQGRAYFENGQYASAVSEWNEVLKLDPNHDLARAGKEKALAEWKKNVLDLIAKADKLYTDKRYHEAIRTLDEAENLNFQDEQIVKNIKSKIQRYENALDFDDLYRQGLEYFNEKNYKMAWPKFEKALQLEPRNETIKNFYNDAKARAMATYQQMPPELQQKYVDGVNLTNKGKYEEALKIFQEIREKQPYNKRILNAIDKAKEGLNRSKKLQR
ncbi:hypothetical protein AMJ86_00575 [bacterium SM23_57]|nr:MAG: hypothetical protein AMJ86_00575 [bacterium SM23_57]